MNLNYLILILGLVLSFSSWAGELKVLTFNVWDLKAYGISVSHHIKDRLKILPAKLVESGADIIALQEVWENKSKHRLEEVMAKKGYPYTFYVDSGIGLGNGLMIISKFPIVKHDVSDPYRIRTRLDEIAAHKAAFHLLIEVPGLAPIDVYTTHLGAVTFDEKHDGYNGVQKEKLLNQLVQFSDWVKKTQKSNNIIVAGDFNIHYQEYNNAGHFKPKYAKDYAYLAKNLCNRGEATNTYLNANNLDATNTPHYTYNRENPYVASGLFSGAPSEVDDYIFICQYSDLSVTSSKLIFNEALPEFYKEKFKLRKLPLRLSDHYGILTTFTY